MNILVQIALGLFTGLLFGFALPMILLKFIGEKQILAAGATLIVCGKLICSLRQDIIPLGLMIGLFGCWLIFLAMAKCDMPQPMSWIAFIIGTAAHLMFGIDVVALDINVLRFNYLISLVGYVLIFYFVIRVVNKDKAG